MSFSLDQVLKQTQKLAMTPQMQQSIRLLQLTCMELEQLAQQEIVENPFLEIAEEEEETQEEASQRNTLTSQAEKDEVSEQKANVETKDSESPNRLADLDVNWDEVYDDSENQTYFPPDQEESRDFTEYTAKPNSLSDHLLWQLRVSNLSDRDREIGEFLIGNIDNNGYLRASVDEIAGTLDADVRRVEAVLQIIQNFEPSGVGARNLKECLLIQMRDRGITDPLSIRIVTNYLDLALHKKFKELARKLGVREKRLKKAMEIISSLEPHPGRSITKDQPSYVEPDVIVKKVNGKYLYYLDEGNSARLRISPFYRRLLQDNNFDKNERRFAMEKFKSAVWLIKNIEKRRNTILKVTEAIINFQKDFVEKGIEHLRPLTLREVAEVTELHESTVARVTSGKYVETPRGTFELKFFFSSGLDRMDGEITSSRSAKELIRQLVGAESAKKPYSDKEIAKKLAEKGIKIARRTVAKYREQLDILPAKLRKESN